MKTAHHRFAVAILALLVLPVPAWGAVEEEDPIKAEFRASMKAINDEVASAKALFVKLFDEKMKKIAKTGDLDGYKALQADKEKADRWINLPESHPMRLGQFYLFLARSTARKNIAVAMEVAVKKYTMNLEIDKATATQNLLKRMRETIELDEKIFNSSIVLLKVTPSGNVSPDLKKDNTPTLTIRDAYAHRATAYNVNGELDNAILDINQALQIKPDNKLASPRALLLGIRGSIFLKKHEWINAIKDFSEIILLTPTDPAGYLGRGLAYGPNGNPDKAITDLSQAIRLKQPPSPMAHFERARMYAFKEEHEKAIADYSKVILAEHRLKESYFARAGLYLMNRKYDKAVEDLSKLISMEPNTAGYYHARGLGYMLNMKFDLALSDFSDAIRLKPAVPADTYYLRGRTHKALGNFAKAAADIKKAEELGYKP